MLEAYTTWATAANLPSVNYHQLRRYMVALGHRHMKSDGVHYLDAAFMADVPDLPDTYCVVPLADRASAGSVDLTVAAIDGTLAALRRLRRVLTGQP